MIRYSYNRCPWNTKRDLVEWAAAYFSAPKSRFQKMSKKQLYAIWYKEKEKRKELI